MSTVTVTPSHRSYLMSSLEHATVADAMHPGILSCEPDATLAEAAAMMATHRVHCLAVIGISHQQPELGVWAIISDLDLLRAGIHDGAESTTVRALATGPLVIVEATTPLCEAAESILASGVSHAIVIDAEKERPIGVLSTLDIAGVLARGQA